MRNLAEQEIQKKEQEANEKQARLQTEQAALVARLQHALTAAEEAAQEV